MKKPITFVLATAAGALALPGQRRPLGRARSPGA